MNNKINTKYSGSLVKLKGFLMNSNINEDIKDDVLSRVDQLDYLDKAILGTSNSNDQYSIYINKFYKNILKKRRIELLRLLSLHYNNIK